MPRSLISCAVVTILLARANPGAAQDVDAGVAADAGTVEVEAAVEPQTEPVPAPVPTSPTKATGFDRYALGAYASFGMATLIGDPHNAYPNDSAGSVRPMFAGGGGGYFDLYLTRNVALEVGLGALGKGYRYRFESEMSPDIEERTLAVRYLEIPLGVKLDARGFRVSAAIALEIGLSDETKTEGETHSYTYDEWFWMENRRVNFGPVIGFGYAIPIGSRFRIVPSVSGSVHLLDENACDDHSEDSCSAASNGRYFNVMFHLGAEIGFDGREVADVFTPTPLPVRGFRPFALGAYASLGMARSLTTGGTPGVDMEEGWEVEPRFAGGGGAYFDWYLSEAFALDVGFGFVGKGHRYPLSDYELRLTYLEIPLGAKLDFWGVRIGIALALEIALSGEEQAGGEWEEDSVYEWVDRDWDEFRRVNFGPVLSLGYAIPAGKIAIVPGVSWSMDILDDLVGDPCVSCSWRNMNLMFSLGVEHGFGGGAR